MAGVGLLLRGVWPADSLFGNVIRLDFAYVGTSHDDYTHSVVFALYDASADCDESWPAGKLSQADLLFAPPPFVPQKGVHFQICTSDFNAKLFFSGKPDRRMSDQRLCSGQQAGSATIVSSAACSPL